MDGRSHAPPDLLSRSPFEQAVFGLRSPEQLPRIAEKLENLPLFANSFDPELQARLLSEQMAAQEAHSPSSAKPHGGSYERTPLASENDANLTMKKARSYQALADLEKKGYFPAAPKVRACRACGCTGRVTDANGMVLRSRRRSASSEDSRTRW